MHEYWKHGYRSFHHSIEYPDGSGEQFRDHLAYDTRHRRWQQLPWLQATTIRSEQWEKLNTIEILSRTPFVQVNWVRSSAWEARMDETRRRQRRRQSQAQQSTLPTREIDYHSDKSIERDHQLENIHSMTQSYPWIGNTENWRRFQLTIVSQRIMYTYNSSNVEEGWRTAKTTKAIGRVSEWRQYEMQLPTIHLWTCGKHSQQF
jgi:hypothetical protein